MKIQSAVFTISAPDLASCPMPVLPEFAFIGRSNVGKSSLINLLAEKKDLARVSDMPGKTRLLNFFTINSRWNLVDLPGYGYAKAAKADRLEFNTAVRDYLSQRANLRCVFALIDSRLPPQEIDLRFVHWLGTHEVPFALVFTKIDKQAAQHTRNVMQQFQQAMAASTTAAPPRFATSATTKTGRSEILTFIADTLAGKNAAPKPSASPPPVDAEWGDDLDE